MTPEQIFDDFRRRYEGTYLFVQGPDSPAEDLFYVHEMIRGGAEKLGTFVLVSDALGRIVINFGSAHTLKFKAAPVGVFQYGHEAYCCTRLPAKQYRRGICHDNTQIVSTAFQLYPQNVHMTWGLVDAAFQAKTYSVREAFTMLGTGKYRSVALSDGFSVSLPFNKTVGYVLFYQCVPIAKVSVDGKLLEIGEDAYKTQVLALLEKAHAHNS